MNRVIDRFINGVIVCSDYVDDFVECDGPR